MAPAPSIAAEGVTNPRLRLEIAAISTENGLAMHQRTRNQRGPALAGARASSCPCCRAAGGLGAVGGHDSLFSASPSTELIAPVTPVDPRRHAHSARRLRRRRSRLAGTAAAACAGTESRRAPMVPAGKVALALSARFGKDAPAIDGGLTWRVYAAKPDAKENSTWSRKTNRRRRRWCCRPAPISCMSVSGSPPRCGR